MTALIQGKNKLLKAFELIFTICSLFHLSQAIIPLIISGGASEGDGITTSSLDYSIIAKISLLIYAISFALLILRWKKVLPVIIKNKYLLLLLIVVGLSPLWSVLPDQTFRYSIYAMGTTAFGLYVATRYTLKEQVTIFSWTYALIILFSIIFIVALPHYGIMGAIHAGAIRGIYTHKNQFGLVMVPGAVIFFLRALSGKGTSWLHWLFFVTSIALIVLSRSTTSLGNLLIMLTLCLVYRTFRWRYEVLISVILAATIIGVAGLLWFVNYGESDLLFVAIGKDATLTGRTEIWHYVWEQIQLRPWLGYGLAAFWNGLDGPSAYIELALTISVVYAHNGFLDLWLSIGFIGLSVFAIGFLSAVKNSLSLIRQTFTPEEFWPLLYLTYILLSNIAEGSIPTLDNFFWAVYAMTAFSVLAAKNDSYPVTQEYSHQSLV